MPILNYTTTISTARTAAELQGILAKAGAQKILVDYEEGEAVAITFGIPVGPERLLRWFTLPAKWGGVHMALRRENVAHKYRTDAQAKRVAWRIIKNWCEAQLAIIEAGQAEMAEVFLPYMQTASGQSFYQIIEQGSYRLLEK